MYKLMSCGVIVFRRDPDLSFLLLRQPTRFDLPKGHVEKGEDETTCALRELAEETGLTSEIIKLEPGFRFTTKYYPRYRKFGGRVVEKTVVIFLGWLQDERPVTLTEHTGYEWIRWQPPHRLSHGTIDGVLSQVEKFFSAGMAVPEVEAPR
ncbi:MAG: bis(5'-nucleosyl)-tetraphosphatase [Gemmataceae bacterium]